MVGPGVAPIGRRAAQAPLKSPIGIPGSATLQNHLTDYMHGCIVVKAIMVFGERPLHR
jgi:hypothetical protein